MRNLSPVTTLEEESSEESTEKTVSKPSERTNTEQMFQMSSLFGAPRSESSICILRDEVRARLRNDPASISISWLIQPKKLNNERYVFAKYYESSLFVHSVNDLRLEFSLILRETRDNTMGYFIQCKNLEKGISLSMHADFVMKKKDDVNTFRSFHKTKTEYFVFDSVNSCRGIFNFCDMNQIESFVTPNDIPYLILYVNMTNITCNIAAPLKYYIKT